MANFQILVERPRNAQSARLSQRGILPTAIKTRNLGNIIISRPSDLIGDATSYSFTFGNGDQAVITATLETENNTKLLAILDSSLYVTSVADSNQLPSGSGVDETQYQIIGPWYDWGSTDNKNVKVKLYVLNISAGTVTVLGRSIWRYIANDPNATITVV